MKAPVAADKLYICLSIAASGICFATYSRSARTIPVESFSLCTVLVPTRFFDLVNFCAERHSFLFSPRPRLIAHSDNRLAFLRDKLTFTSTMITECLRGPTKS